MSTSSRLAPADIQIAFPHPPLRRAESQCAYESVPRTFHQVANLCPAQRPLAQIMPPLHQGVPYPRSLAVAAGNRNDADLPQFLQSTPKFRGNAPLINRRLGARRGETGLFCRGQGDEPVPMKLNKRLSAANLLEFAVGGSPLQQFAHTQRQSAPGQRGIAAPDLFNLGDCRRTQFATANLHEAYLTSPTLSVKCVRMSAALPGDIYYDHFVWVNGEEGGTTTARRGPRRTR